MIAFAAGGIALDLGPAQAAVVMVALLAASFFFSGSETAFFSLQKMDRQRFAAGSRSEQRVAGLLTDHSSLITTLLLGNETVNIALAATGAALLYDLAPAYGWLNVVLVTPLLVVVSEITPKVLAFRFNARWARAVSGPLVAFRIATWPVRIVVTMIVDALAVLFMVTPDARSDARLKEAEIRTIVGHGAQSGVLDDRERELIEAVFDFDDLAIGRAMTPAPDVFRLSLDAPWDQVLRLCKENAFSRVPVYETEPDDIIGVLTIKDLLTFRSNPPPTLRRVRPKLRPAVFVPQSKPATDMMHEFLDRRFHQALVVDEHGTFVGLVTLDDLLGELDLGEHDDDTESEIELPDGEYHTVGGFVFHELGRLPRAGDVVAWQGHRFLVGRVESRRITSLHVELAVAAVAEVGK